MSFGGNKPHNPLNVCVNREFQAKMPNYGNRSISKTVNSIKPTFANKAETSAVFSDFTAPPQDLSCGPAA